MKLKHLHKALLDGAKLHSFSSGGGLRVVRIETAKGKLIGYGEHPCIDDALSHADEDVAAGGRPYNKVYGDNGTKPHYLTGSSVPNGRLDAWLRYGSTCDAKARDGLIEVTLRGFSELEYPKDMKNRVQRTRAPERWTERGYTFEMSSDGNGVAIRVVGEYHHEAFMWRTMKTASGPDFMAAVAAAFAAPAVPAPKEQ